MQMRLHNQLRQINNQLCQQNYTRTMKNSYKILKKIGQGEHGSIFLVDGSAFDHPLAMKKVVYNCYTNNSELQLLPKLSHPNIIKILDQDKNQTGYTLYQQYAKQGDLYKYYQKNFDRQVPEAVLMKWLCQIALGLYYLHKQMKILHRDIKTRNILVMENGLLKIADFGTSKQLLKSQDFAMTAVGTPYYLSPEAVGSSKYNSKSDVWGLGCIMFELSTGKKPFQGTSLNDLIKKILNDEIQEIPQNYSPQFRNLVKEMLEKDFEKRITIEGILEKSQVKNTFYSLKSQYEKQYKDLVFPYNNDIKTRKYCERQEFNRKDFTTSSLKTVKNQKKEKLGKIDIIEAWNKDGKYSLFPVKPDKSEKPMSKQTESIKKIEQPVGIIKEPVKKIEHTKYLNKSLQALIDKKKKNTKKNIGSNYQE